MKRNDESPSTWAQTSPAKDAESFREAGFSPEAAEAIVTIDAAMTRIRRSMMRRETAAAILGELDPSLDLQKLDVMSAVMHWHPENDADATREVTVGTVAERMGIDPSRASRLVAEVVEAGYIRRIASQQDSRRIVLEPTDKGVAFGEEFRARKTAMMTTGMGGWTEAELTNFATLLERFSQWARRGPENAPKET
jgi:DNA-binding MarR family transcriptional regulator